MAELNRTDPGDIHAVVVGLENYPRAAEMSLRGAADNALRFARWLRGGGVPKKNITVLLSALDEDECVTAAAEGADVTWRPVGTAEDIRTVFVHELATVSGGLLYVYWGGHGALGRDHGGRLLFTPDACADDLRCVGVEELRDFLTRDDLSGFTQQVFFFDACAAFVEQYQLDVGPVRVPFPRRPRREVEQFLLYAARDGQEAEQDSATGTGLFSRTALDWLEKRATDLHPDLPRLERHVRTSFEDGYTDTGPLQTPMAYHYRALDGTGFSTAFARTDRAALLEVVGTLHKVFGKDDSACLMYAARIGKACGHSPATAKDPAQWFAGALLTRPRMMATFIEALVHDKKNKAARAFLRLALAHGAPGLLSVQEHADLRDLLARWPALSPVTVNMLTDAAAPSADAHVTANGVLSTAQLMDHVARLEEYPGGWSQVTKRFRVPALVAFTKYLTVHTGPSSVPYPLRNKLDRWGDRVAERLFVESADVDGVRDRAAEWDEEVSASSAPPRVVVQVYPQDEPDTFVCVVWSDAGTGKLAQYNDPDNGVPLSSARGVRLVQRALGSLTAEDGSTPVVEIVLRREHIVDVLVHAWDGAGGTGSPLLLGVEQGVTLRCAPLAAAHREQSRRASLKRRWARRSLGKVVHLDESHADDDPRATRAYGALSTDGDASRAVVLSGRRAGALLVRAALAVGYPVVLWDSEDSQALDPAVFAPLQPEGDLAHLPERVRSYWARTRLDPVGHPVRPALLLEDHDRQLPPVLSLTRSPDPEEEASC
ncbi:hypothetical protein [Streptomyces sp. S.PNR 29]|uniref:VMAP-C domain-containing protein n=1 Tax=Streptomyces sp. S.PNR 29 TaxID=2973805 RepID=UPI0025AF7483|nr:hypothetical protein [Streptomyces sp. S.PNR 29]MDN0199157.1 caspase family protein [Streptomyces sp. S.PNR 29]